jgi:hypothetical protein
MLDRGLNNNQLAEFTTRILDMLTKSLGFDLETTRWSSVTINLDASIAVSNIERNNQMECYFTSMTLLDSFMVSLLNFVCPRQLDLTRIKNVYKRIAVLFKQIYDRNAPDFVNCNLVFDSTQSHCWLVFTSLDWNTGGQTRQHCLFQNVETIALIALALLEMHTNTTTTTTTTIA